MKQVWSGPGVPLPLWSRMQPSFVLSSVPLGRDTQMPLAESWSKRGKWHTDINHTANLQNFHSHAS